VHLYVYYDVPEGAASEVRRRLEALRDLLRPHEVRLMRRVDGGTTWMEIHESVDPGFEETLAAVVDRLGIAALTGPRHIERFVELG
jgi:hypothetical protein